MPRPTPQRMLPTPPAYSSLAPWSPGVALPFLFLLPSAPFRPPAAAPSFPDRASSARIACSNSSGRLARARPRRAAASRRAQTMRQRPSNAAAYATGRSGTSQETASAAGSAAAAAAADAFAAARRAASCVGKWWGGTSGTLAAQPRTAAKSTETLRRAARASDRTRPRSAGPKTVAASPVVALMYESASVSAARAEAASPCASSASKRSDADSASAARRASAH
mmetsp:Transcript_10991/g.35002  ORF Transcript_10991/g.35002 Transcript_10991/m.35002 type:complete len:224 (-) Transcript_10991:451-1122(-)